ncbi:ferritin-like domain-containing protein [Actinomadura fibrosa]|uniref:Ferritin-like domain-containing protein n=1 Tax=Actinomadura fibrosa TaxID=111802 RepID=A0ABW2XZ47_9ACTN|nr:ferritin-like domain-containing protein [Actinomadura fibrosa]
MPPVRAGDTLLEVDAHIRACLNWDYGHRDTRLWQLYERSKVAQWNVSTDIDWTPEVRLGSVLNPRDGLVPPVAPPGSPVPPELWNAFLWEFQVWMVSQFLHGEQGALLTTARLVETVPDIEAKTYAAAQVADEARHVEAYARYIDEKIGASYPVNAGLERLLRDLLGESRWDVLYLGVQVVIEGLALVATRVASTSFGDPVIQAITRLVARDEARHISFGVVALDGLYRDMTSAELADRDAFLQEAVHVMAQRFLLGEVWERLGADAAAGRRFVRGDPRMTAFRRLLFFKVVQVLRQIGMLTPGLRDLMLAESLAAPEAFAR